VAVLNEDRAVSKCVAVPMGERVSVMTAETVRLCGGEVGLGAGRKPTRVTPFSWGGSRRSAAQQLRRPAGEWVGEAGELRHRAVTWSGSASTAAANRVPGAAAPTTRRRRPARARPPPRGP
jgi:hypothetical protein